MPSEWKKIDELYFDADSSLLKRVGRESISDPIVAIVELIKNSYDADAKKVKIIFENVTRDNGKIIIKDDGEGMSSEELSKKWMMLSVPDKENNPITKKLKRIKIGEKGIGRLGVEGISESLEIISKPVGSNDMFKLEINWKDYPPGTPLNKVPNNLLISEKNKQEKGFEIILKGVKGVWNEERIRSLKEQISLITPIGIDLSFSIDLECKEFPKYEGEIENNIIKKYLFHFKAELNKDKKAIYYLKQRKGKSYKLPEEGLGYSCGPIIFEFYFFYRDAQKYPEEDIDINKIKDFLDRYGGIKLYRDNFLVRLQGKDWLQLNQMRVLDPGMIPGTDQIFGFLKITKHDNPLIKDTTNREGLVENDSYKDLIAFIKRALLVFRDFRKQIEYYPGTRKKMPVEEQLNAVKRSVKRIPKKPRKEKKNEKETLLSFSKNYPSLFYNKLEDEINNCYKSDFPNAVFFLCRKMIENFLYEILRKKFPKKEDQCIWWNEEYNQPHGLSPLIKNLSLKHKSFEPYLQKYLIKVIPYLEKIRNEANPNVHNIYDYFDSIKDLNKFKIDETMQLLIYIWGGIK
jgi:hypothetical protein